MDDMYKVMKKFMSHWSSLQGSNNKVDKKALQEIFDTIDVDGDGEVTLLEYKRVMIEQPGIFSWFDILNSQKLQ
jgi:Ca2+-binding EF-hand superfamily protein